MALSIDAAKEAKEDVEQQQSGLRENDAGIPDELVPDFDDEEVVRAKIHPEALVSGSHISRITINSFGDDDILSMEQNLEGAGNHGYQAIITIANPEIERGVVWVDDPESDFPEYKILGDPTEDDEYELSENVIRDDNGDVKGAEVDGIIGLGPKKYEGQPVEGEFNPDHLQVIVAASRAGQVLGQLDTAGQWYSDSDGNVVEGLLEAPPEMGSDEYDRDRHGYPRLTGYPELREDMVGERVAVSALREETNSSNDRKVVQFYRVTEDDELEGLAPLTVDDDAYNKPTYPRVNNTYWDESGEPQDVGEDTEPETDDTVEDAQELLDDDDLTYRDLPDADSAFVDEAVESLAANGLSNVSELEEETDLSLEERIGIYEDDEGVNVENSANDLATIIDAKKE